MNRRRRRLRNLVKIRSVRGNVKEIVSCETRKLSFQKFYEMLQIFSPSIKNICSQMRRIFQVERKELILTCRFLFLMSFSCRAKLLTMKLTPSDIHSRSHKTCNLKFMEAFIQQEVSVCVHVVLCFQT